VKVEGGEVYVELPPEHVLDAELATDLFCISAGTSHAACDAAPSEPARSAAEVVSLV